MANALKIKFVILLLGLIAPSVNAYALKAAPEFYMCDDTEYNPEDDLLYYTEGEIDDPMEVLNRQIFYFNMFFDQILLQPITYTYTMVVPEYGRNRIRDFTRNLVTPVTMVNDVLQGKFEDAGVSFWRFIINTTVGFLGFMDVASLVDLKYHKEDFGQTLASYDIPSGPYIMLPLLGPSSPRDVTGRIVDFTINPLDYNFGKNWKKDVFKSWKTKLAYVKLMQGRADKDAVIDTILNKSIDPYTTMRSLYIQNRNLQIRDGKRQVSR
jgi:phospholipid-binding lipoprotein MlaA